MARLAVLDMAGTTVADGGTVEAAFTSAMDAVNLGPGHPAFPGALDHVRRTMGMSKIHVFRALLRGDEELAQQANLAFEAAYEDTVRTYGAVEIPGALAAIRALRDADWKVCLTTGFSATTRDLLIEALDWRDEVDLALSPGPGVRGRPYPDLILSSVLQLDIDDVLDVVVVGDTANDLLAGYRSGAGTVVGVLTGAHDRQQLASAPHHHLLPSIVDLPSIVALGVS